MKQFWELLYYGENHSAEFISRLHPNITWVSYYFDNKLISNYLSNILRLIPESRDYREFVLQHFESHGDEKIFELIALDIDEYKFDIFVKPLCMKKGIKIQIRTLGRFFLRERWIGKE